MWMRAAIALSLLCACAEATAQVRACVADDGGLVYTDKACAALGAVERRQAPKLPGLLPRYRSGCVRDLQEFIYALSSAIEVDDVNRLAGLYRWKGTTSRESSGLMHRLETLASRPLLQVVPVYRHIPDGDIPDGDMPALLPAPSPAPAALRLDQTLADGITPASTTLQLHRELGCWWVAL